MTKTRDKRDALLEAIANSAVELLRFHDLERSLPSILEKLGTAAGADRMQLMQYEKTPAGEYRIACHHGWRAPGIEPSILTGWVEGKTMEEVGFRPWGDRLSRGEIIIGASDSFEAPIRTFLERDGVRSVVIVPVFVEGSWWGLIGFDDCTRVREWASAEIDVLKTLAELVGMAVLRTRSIAQLADAQRIVENSPTVLYRLDCEPPYLLQYVSPNIERYGYTAEELLAAPGRWLKLIDHGDRPDVMRAVKSIAHEGADEADAEFRLVQPDGTRVWFDGRASAYPPGSETTQAVEGIMTDVTERKEAAREIEHMARTDSLTGLLNRGAFLEQLEKSCANAEKEGAAFALHFIDLDKFKSVNDTLGHPAGDALLKAAAQRLVRSVRQSDVVARFGGDEFAVLQLDVSSARLAETMARKIREAAAQPYKIAGRRIEVTVSVGVEYVANGRVQPEEVMMHADLALYNAKEDGRDRVQVYRPGLKSSAGTAMANRVRPLPAA